MSDLIHVALSGEFFESDGRPAWPGFDLSPLESDPRIELTYLPYTAAISPDHIEDIDVLILLHNRVTTSSFHANGRLNVVIRFGAGYDRVDVDACTAHAVALVTTPEGVRRPMAVAILTLMLSLTTRLPEKMHLARMGDEGFFLRSDYMGIGLRGKTLGLIGLGNIGSELVRLTRPLDLAYVAFDPYIDPTVGRELGVELLGFEECLRRADILTLNCPLTEETHHLIDNDALSEMKPTSFLINTARGPIVDQRALTDALLSRRIAGAGLDVLEFQPISPDDPLLGLSNVIVTPNALGWTDALCEGNGRGVVQAVQTLLEGRTPTGIINKEVTTTARWQVRLEELLERQKSMHTDTSVATE